jgi:hypothetical protein
VVVTLAPLPYSVWTLLYMAVAPTALHQWYSVGRQDACVLAMDLAHSLRHSLHLAWWLHTIDGAGLCRACGVRGTVPHW